MPANPDFLPLRYRIRLRDQINTYYDLAEFQTLCFDLGVSYDDLAGSTRSNKIEDLIGQLERAGAIAQLIAYCQEKRPHISWQDQARVFISYKRHAQVDNELANFLAAGLQREGHRPFIDTTMRVGTAWLDQIDQELQESDFLVVLLSRDSADSEMVQQEVYRAHQYHRLNGRPEILPIRMRYEGMLPYSIAAFVNTHQYLVWNGPDDNERTLSHLIGTIAGEALEMPSQFFVSKPPSITVVSEDGRPASRKDEIQPPLPAFDPRLITDLEAPGGTMRINDALYIEREADGSFRRQLSRTGTITTIRASRQTGKSSLLVRGIHHAREAGSPIVCLDLQTANRDDLSSPDTFLLYLANYIVHRLRLDISQVERFWKIPLGAQNRLTALFEESILPTLDKPLILAIDEADRLLKTDFYSDFFALLRSWHNSAAYEPLWEKINLAMVISTEPYLLIADPNQSPFNVGQKFYLDDFDESQVLELNRRHGNPLASAELSEFQSLLGGHPYLTRRALYIMVTEEMDWPALLKVAASDNGPFSDHLRRQMWLLHRRPELVVALRAIVRQQHCADEDARFRLLRAGLIKTFGDICVPRCDLYQAYFRKRLE